MVEKIQIENFRTEKVAPEGGYGYLVALALAIPCSFYLGVFASFGLLFNDFLTSVGAGTSGVTIIVGFFHLCVSLIGLIVGSLIKKFTLRPVGIFGAIIYFAGSVTTIFSTSVLHLIISMGILQGTGMGLMVPVAYATFNQYFVKKRIFTLSVTQIVKGAMATGYPILVQFLMQSYGFRGALAVIAIVQAHAIVAMFLMQPVEWHYKEIRIPIDESENLMHSDQKEANLEMSIVSKKTNSENFRNSMELNQINEEEDDNNLAVIKSGRSISLVSPPDLNGFNSIQKRVSSIMSLGDVGGVFVLEENSSKKGIWQKIVELLDLTLLNDFVYLNVVIAITVSWYADSTLFTLLPMYLFELGFDTTEAAKVVAMGSGADLFARIFLAVVSYYIELKARYIFFTAAVVILFMRIGFLYITDFIGMRIIVGILGFLRAWFYVTPPLIIAEMLSSEKFASGFGLYLFIQGILSFLLAPVVGWIRDATESYPICFNTLTLILALCVISWIGEMLWVQCFGQKTKRTEQQP